MHASHTPRAQSAVAVDNRQLLRSVMIGIAAGLSASWIMDRFQAVVNAASSEDDDSKDSGQDKPSTVKAADMLSEAAVGEPVPDRFEEPAGSAVHYGFGAFLGGVYGAMGEFAPGIRAGFGAAYGAGVALVADEALVPAVGLAPPPQQVPARTHAYGIVSHLVFGAALEASRRLIEQAMTRRQGNREGQG